MIKFRGVPLDDYSHDANVDFDGTFIYGNYEKVGDDVLISSGKFDLEGIFVPDLFAKVDPKTVGQFTGLTDVNGKDIYNGDIVHVVTEDGYERTGKVIFEKCCYWVDNGMDKYPVNRIGCERDILEVVGNAHANLELIDFYNMKQLGDI